ncbi:MAG: ATP-binding protein [Desulfobacteraceae bacterium]|nr:MAG: ATP-binding protein [Desulfobacteraceae bacterium]
MLADQFIIEGFEPLWLTIDNIGPFRDQPYEIDFTDNEGVPCNLFLLMSRNGQGKTTILDIITRLMDFVFQENPRQFGNEDIDYGKGRVQWDIRLKVTWRGKKISVLLSLLAGYLSREYPAIKEWTNQSLEKYNLSDWHRIGFRRQALGGNWQVIGKSEEFIDTFIGIIQAEKLLSSPPDGFEAPTLFLPRVLFFSAYRDIERVTSSDRAIIRPDNWGYSPTYKINSQGNQWQQSLDNLLVWLKWLDDGRFDRARDLINKRVFSEGNKFLEDVRKDPPEAIINSAGQRHRLDQLSSGEKSLVQLFLRIGAHMTQHTIILIDELDIHLHPNWQHHIIALFKEFVRDHPSITVIASTHSREILSAFPLDIPEEGVRKGGFIIKEGIAEEYAKPQTIKES